MMNTFNVGSWDIGYAIWLDAAYAIMRALDGKHILVTRAAEQMHSVAACVRQFGGIPIAFPCLAVQCCAGNIGRGVRQLERDGAQALFSSVNGVQCVADVLGDAFVPTFQTLPVVAIGRHTAEALANMGVTAAWTPDEASQEGLMDAWRQRGLPQALVFFRAETGRDALPIAMQQADVDVRLIAAYRTVCPGDDASSVIQSLKNGHVDAVLLGSSRTVQHYIQRVGDAHLANNAAIAVISEQVADAARALHLDVQVVAKEASFASMLDGLQAWFQKKAA